jgi:aspartyl-tRNA synthetase
VHNRATAVPFPVDDESEANEEARLTYRYVDLRRGRLQRALRTKVRIVRGRKAGRIELHYFSEEELQRLYDLLLESSRRKV